MMMREEGFICPTCMVNLATSSLLQDHWIRFHSSFQAECKNRRSERCLNDKAGFVQFPGADCFSSNQITDDLNKQKHNGSCTGGGNQTTKHQMFHIFKNHRVPKPTFCDFCGDIVWSESSQCKACAFLCHKDCSPLIVTLCENWEKDKQRAAMRARNGSARPIPQLEPPPIPKSFLEQIRHQVSRGRTRHVEDSLDLDLTYITDRIIAMSFPASGLESTYRNSLADVAFMLHQKHGNKYVVFNVSERRYDISKLNNQVLDFGWPDHLAPPLDRLVSVIKSMDSWLCADDENVAVVHCKGGKGRTGVVISAYIQFNKVCPSPQAALDWFALRRFYDSKFGGVTQPSQKRYVHYFGDLLEKKLVVRTRTLLLTYVMIHGVPNFDGKGGCKPYLRIYQGYQQIFTSHVYFATRELERVCIHLDDLPLCGDVMVKCLQKSNLPSLQDTIFRCQFHVDAIKSYSLILRKKELDEACKDRRFPENCTVEFIFKPAPEQELQEQNIVAVFTSLSSDSGIDSPVKHMSETQINDHVTFRFPRKQRYHNSGGGSEGMETEQRTESLGVPRHFPGPINGNPYALVDRKVFTKNYTPNSGHKMMSGGSGKSTDVTKGIKDLDNLLNELGYLSASCKGDVAVEKDANSNVIHEAPSALPTINVINSEISKCNQSSNAIDENDGFDEQYSAQIMKETRVKPHLPPRTSSVGAVDRHQGMSLHRAFSDATDHPRYSSPSSVPHTPVTRHQSLGSDDVFSSDEPISPAVSEMLDELAKSPLSPDNARRFWQRRRPTNLSTRYENVSESSYPETDEVSGEFRQGRVKDHVRQFNRILTSPDPTRVGTGIPMPGLVQGINCEEKISRFNYRSLAPGQCGPHADKLYLAGSPPKRILYDPQSTKNPIANAEVLFIPSYADRPAAYYLDRAKAEKNLGQHQQGANLSNGHIPPGSAIREVSPEKPLHVRVNDSEYLEESNGVHRDRSDARPRSDSAYGGSVKGSSVTSTPVASNPPKLVSSPRNDNGKSSGRGSHTSSVASSDDQDSSGYARIEDIEIMKERVKTGQAQAIREPDLGVLQEQEVIAVSHTVVEESFPERLNKRVPDIKSGKDLSIAVYQSNYLPGLTNGQPRILSNNQIDMTDKTPDRAKLDQNMNLDFVITSQTVSPDVLSPNILSPEALSPDHCADLHSRRSTDTLKKISVATESNLGPGIHLVDSPPSPAYSARSDSSSVTASPGRKTLRHRLRRSNSSSSSLSSSELFPDVVKYPHVKFDKDNLKFWYKPRITRDEAIALLKNKCPGTFVVRDSQSYDGAFGLAVKVDAPPIGVLQQAGRDLSKFDLENELVRHFLIEPCKQGVRLKGNNNEPAFPSLVALIFQHSVTKMALPIELVLPTEDIENSDCVDGVTEEQLLRKGAACDLVYLASIDVEGLSGDGAIKYAINKVLSTSFNSKSTIVTIKVNQEGITLTDLERRIFFRKHYIMKDALCCMMDPRGRRFTLKMIIPELTHEAPCFGIVVRKPQNPMEHECLVFAEMDPVQPATAVIDFVQRAMRNGKK